MHHEFTISLLTKVSYLLFCIKFIHIFMPLEDAVKEACFQPAKNVCFISFQSLQFFDILMHWL